MNYWTSDWHCHHVRCLEFDNRPFSTVGHMHQVLINNYNASVSEHDTCYFLGDMYWGQVTDLAKIINQLNGTKILLLGNHDGSVGAMKKAGFDVIMNMAAITIGGQLVTMSHCPLRDTFREDTSKMSRSSKGEPWHGHDKNQNFSWPNFGQFHLHGHCHSKPENKILGRQFDVGVPGNSYRPVSQSQIESWIALTLKKEKDNETD